MSDERITIRLSSAEKQLIEQRAFYAKKTISAYCRSILLDVEQRMITNQHILFHLEKIDALSESLDELKQTKESGNLNILIELLLYMRSIVEPTKRKMVSAELKRIKVEAWESKKSEDQ